MGGVDIADINIKLLSKPGKAQTETQSKRTNLGPEIALLCQLSRSQRYSVTPNSKPVGPKRYSVTSNSKPVGPNRHSIANRVARIAQSILHKQKQLSRGDTHSPHYIE